MAEQRYQGVLAVISDGLSVLQVGGKGWSVASDAALVWLTRYEAEGSRGWWIGRIGRRAVRTRCAHRWRRRSRPYWGPSRLVFELAKRRVSQRLRLQGPSELGERILSDDRVGETGSVTLRMAACDPSPPRCVQLMGLALRGYLVLVLGATADGTILPPVPTLVCRRVVP